MNQILIEPAPSNVQRVRPIAGKLGVVAALVVMLAVGLWLARGPAFVNHVGVTNKSGYDLNVDVTSADHDGWLPISVATGGSTTMTREVIDQGDTWVFRFSYAGKDAGEVSIPRATLAKHSWTVSVPDEVVKNLNDAGILPGP